MKAFCDNCNLTGFIKQPTCYKNPNNLTYIDLILSNTSNATRFSSMALTVMKKSFRKFHPRLINYRSYKNSSTEVFREYLIEILSNKVFVTNDKGLKRFCDINLQVLNQYAPQNIQYVWGNEMPFMTKQLSKEMMKRSRSCNNFLRNRTKENARELCLPLLGKSNRGYYENLNIKNVTDNRLTGDQWNLYFQTNHA